jgi:hypothetical protein
MSRREEKLTFPPLQQHFQQNSRLCRDVRAVSRSGSRQCGARVRPCASLLFKEYELTFPFFPSFLLFVPNSILPHPDFQFYETVQLINLCPMESEEAKALIPRCVSSLPPLDLLRQFLILRLRCSLKTDDDSLQQHLDELSAHRKQQQT